MRINFVLFILSFVSFSSLGQQELISNPNIVVIDIDKISIKKINSVLEYVRKQDPKVIALDINLEYHEYKNQKLLTNLLETENLVVAFNSHRFYNEYKNRLIFATNTYNLNDKEILTGFDLSSKIEQKPVKHMIFQVLQLYDSTFYDKLISTIAPENNDLGDLTLDSNYENIQPMFLTINSDDELSELRDDLCVDKIVLIGPANRPFKSTKKGKDTYKTGSKHKDLKYIYRTTVLGISIAGLLSVPIE